MHTFGGQAMRADMFRTLGLGLAGAIAVSCGAWAQSVPTTPQQAAEIEAVRQMQQDEADQQAEYDRMEAEQADADQRAAEQADADMRRDDAQTRRSQQERDMRAADELARAMDDQADLDTRISEMEQRLAEMDARHEHLAQGRNAVTEVRWRQQEDARMAECRAQYAGAIRGIHAQYDAKALEVKQSGNGDHIAEQLAGLQAARDRVIDSLLQEQCMAPHERRARDENERRVQQVRDGTAPMPVITPPPSRSIAPTPRPR